MALDPSIPFRALNATVPLENPQDVQAKALSIRNLLQQNQMGGLQLQEAKQQQSDEQAARNLFAQNPNASDQDILKTLGASKTGIALIKARQDAAKSAADLREAQFKGDQAEANFLGSHANAVKEANYSPQEFENFLSTAQAHKIQLPYDQLRQQAAQSPDGIKQVVDTVLAKSDEQRKLMEEKRKNDLEAAKENAPKFESVPPGHDYGYFDPKTQKFVKIGTTAEEPKSVGSFTDANGVHNQVMLQPDKTLTTVPLGKAGRVPVPGVDVPLSPAVQAQKVQTAGALAQARQAVQNQTIDIKPDSKEFRQAQDMAYGKLTFSDFNRLYGRGGLNVAMKNAIYDKARELNPSFNPAAFEMGYKLAANPKVQQQLASMDNVMSAVPDLLKFSDDATRTGITKLNDLIIKGGVQLGNKKYSNLQTARTAFADELSGALGFGSATDMSREMGFDMTRPDLSPDAFRSAIQDVVVPFIQRKKRTLLNQMGPYGQPGMNPAAGPQSTASPTSAPTKPLTEKLILANMQRNPNATRQQIIDGLKAAGYQEQQ
jgi:hypothetical protein